MTAEVIHLSVTDLALASLLLLASGAISLALQLRLERKLALAAVRTVLQLFLIGYVLRWVFDLDQPAAVLAVMLLMIAAAGRAATQRPARTFRGATWRAFATLVVSGLLTTFAVTAIIIRVEPWYRPQYVIPLLGMILGNGLTGISLCLETLLDRFVERRHLIEMELAHGATAWEAARDPVRDAVRCGMIPIINSMMVVGIVLLPGMMTGQILAGVDPAVAVRYQIVVMFMIAAATSLGCILIALLTFRAVFSPTAQLQVGRIRKRE